MHHGREGKCPCYVVMAPEYGEGQRVAYGA